MDLKKKSSLNGTHGQKKKDKDLIFIASCISGLMELQAS